MRAEQEGAESSELEEDIVKNNRFTNFLPRFLQYGSWLAHNPVAWHTLSSEPMIW